MLKSNANNGCGSKAYFKTNEVYLSLLLSFCGGVLFVNSANAAPAFWSKERVQPIYIYDSVHGGTKQYFLTPLEACVYALPESYVSPGYSEVTFSNPRAIPGGCVFHAFVLRVPSGEILVDSDDEYPGYYFASMVCPYPGWEQSGDWCERVRPARFDQCNKVGNPLIPAGGCKYQVETDYEAPTKGDLSLNVQRQYSSENPLTYDGPLGTNWFLVEFGRYLTFYSETGTDYVLATRALGDVHLFTLSAGSVDSEAGDSDRLQAAPGTGNGAAWQYFDSQTNSTELYDSAGRLISITRPSGNSYQLSYEANQLTIIDSFGRQISLELRADGRISKMIDLVGGHYMYGYDEDATASNNPSGRLTSVSYPDGSIRRYNYEPEALSRSQFQVQDVLVPGTPTFENTIRMNLTVSDEEAFAAAGRNPAVLLGSRASAKLTGITDENGDRYATFGYNFIGHATSTEHAGGTSHFTAKPDSSLTSSTVTDPSGTTSTYQFVNVAGVKRVKSISRPCATSSCSGNDVRSFGYDSNGNVKTLADFNGVITWFDYDAARNLEITRIEAQGRPEERTITTTWHSTFRLPATITEPGRVTEFIYDNATGNMLSKTLRDTQTNKSRVWTYSYTTALDYTLPNLPKTANGPRTDVADVTTYGYYTNGDLKTITNALSHATEITSYDGNGRATGITDPNGIVTTITYFPRGWLHTSNVAGEITTYEYDGVGQVTRITSPSGVVVRFVYDAAHRLTDIYDAQENHIHYTLDNMGNRVTEEVLNSASQLITTKRREFDALNRLWHDIGALNQTTTYSYDAMGNLTSVDGPLASNTDETKFEYDALNRRTTAIDALLGVTRFSFDALDQLTRVTDPRNLVTQYTVNALGDVTKLESPDTAVTDKTYDEAGNVKTSANARGIVATYTYDALNRVTRISYSSNGGTIDFTYDVGLHALGKLTGMTDSSGTTQWTYNSKGRVASRVQTVSGQSGNLTTQYGYDNGGNLALITYPSGKVLTYGYRDGRIDSILLDNAPIMTGVTYQPFGPVKGWTWGNGVQYSRLFDSDGRIYSYPFGDSARVLGYDDASRIRSSTDSASAQTFGYDALDRLTDWVAPYNQQTYGYDATGNRTLLGTGSNLYGYSVDAASNRLTSVAGPTSRNYIYDEVGNINYDGSRTFGFDARNNISSSYTTDGTTTYQLNGWNQRVRKSGPTVKTGATVFAYDERGHFIGEYDSTGKMIEETIYIGDLPVAVSR